jgi:hypothetical protein
MQILRSEFSRQLLGRLMRLWRAVVRWRLMRLCIFIVKDAFDYAPDVAESLTRLVTEGECAGGEHDI